MTLTKGDLNQIDKLFNSRVAEKMDALEGKFEKRISGVKNEAKLTEFKSEFFEKVDPILKEVTTAREERPLIENRIETLEKIHPQGKHAAAI